MPQGTLITIGGGGFSTGSEPELDAYVLAQSSAPCPNIGFIGTASGDSDHHLIKFYHRFTALHCRPSHLPMFLRVPDLAAWLRAQDVIYVGGGNTKSMLAVWQTWGLTELLAGELASGKVLAGVSAGAICWFQQGITDSAASSLQALPGLGWLHGSCCPHYSNEPARRPSYAQLLRTGQIGAGIGIDDAAAVHFEHGLAQRLVIAKPHAMAYYVSLDDTGVLEQPLGIDTLRI